MLALILDANDSLYALVLLDDDDEDGDGGEDSVPLLDDDDIPVFNILSLMSHTLHTYRLCLPSTILPVEVSYWIKPQSTRWFSRFLVEQYDNTRWISMFRMMKDVVFNLAELLRPHVEKQNTKYSLAILVLIQVVCTLFKLTHGTNLTICSEMFAVG